MDADDAAIDGVRGARDSSLEQEVAVGLGGDVLLQRAEVVHLVAAAEVHGDEVAGSAGADELGVSAHPGVITTDGHGRRQERGLALAFHSGVNWGEPVFKGCNRFISVHALGFTFYNILHCTNWVINGMGERFPKLPVIWTESGLAWIPFLMQRLDHEYMLRPSEAPLLKKKPSDYMRDMYYSSQPMEGGLAQASPSMSAPRA